MVAESWDFNTCFSACLVDGVGGIDRYGLSVNVDVEHVVQALGWSEISLRKADEAKVGDVGRRGKSSSL